MEQCKQRPIRFGDVANCDKRRQSDLFNILNALDVFTSHSERMVVWRGLSAVTSALIRFGIEKERESQTKTITEIFQVGVSPKLETLVRNFLTLYIFLGEKCLNIREVVMVMANSLEHSKKVLRRLYLVVFVLEQIGIIKHGHAYSHYILQEPLDVITSAIFEEVPNLGMFGDESVEILLNKLDKVYIATIHNRRREMYQSAVNRFSMQE